MEVSAQEIENPGQESVQVESQETPQVEPQGAEPSVQVAPPPYQPNLSYKVKGQEKKFDEWIAPIIKDAETEKKVRELYETRDGIGYVKSEREQFLNENKSLKSQIQQTFQPAYDTVQQLLHFRNEGNLPAFFQLSGIPLQEVFKFAYQYANSSPEARAQMEQGANQGIQAYGAQRQQQTAEQMALQQAADFKTREFEMITTYDPQVSRVAADFDGKHGPGSFFEQVRRTGLYHYQTRGVDLSVKEAVDEVVRLFGGAPQGAPQANMANGAPMQAAPQPNMVSTPTAPTPKPVIPGFSGNGTSPVKKVATSFAEIRKRANELRDE